ncbi:hypothetical protein [Acidiphilium angustum]|uniref:Uncharacterized protein n=2 Tax=Acidiphilium rubrum TaxID=526 RepID=A0A8G2FFN1_ACIRU|nr:hypothetical protein [Acidiphilium angustum]SIQ46371.1 hypothetical protein SAMN05421828_10524 [Acidiphilium rubrum]
MAHQIDTKTADRLGKVLNLLGSNHDGERATAAAKAHAILTGAGLTWPDLIGAALQKPHRPPEFGTWRQTCRECLARDKDLRQWERGFLNDPPKFQRISTKQRYCLNEIAIRLGIRERKS